MANSRILMLQALIFFFSFSAIIAEGRYRSFSSPRTPSSSYLRLPYWKAPGFLSFSSSSGGAKSQSIDLPASAESFSDEKSSAEECEDDLHVILVAGGVGKRMKDAFGVPKQYIEIHNQPIIKYSIDIFLSLPNLKTLVIVASPSFFPMLKKLVGCEKRCILTAGGKERFNSVWNGLCALESRASSSSLVAIHDAARPCISFHPLNQVIKDASKYGAAVLAVPVTSTLKMARYDDRLAVFKTLNRDLLWEIQTPQVFRFDILKKAYNTIMRVGGSSCDRKQAICGGMGFRGYLEAARLWCAGICSSSASLHDEDAKKSHSLASNVPASNLTTKESSHTSSEYPPVFDSCSASSSSPEKFKDFTDDASVLESLGYRVRITPGEPQNIKITVNEDVMLASSLLKKMKQRNV